MTLIKTICSMVLFLMVSSLYAADQVDMKYDSAVHEHIPAPLPGACTIIVGKISDDRPNKETVGNEFRTLLSGDLKPWITEALNNLTAYGFKVIRSDDAQQNANAITVNADLYRSYSWNGPMRINGMVAMEVEYIRAGAEPTKHKIRAFAGKTNWAGATSEYMTALNFAMNNVLDKLAKELEGVCQAI